MLPIRQVIESEVWDHWRLVEGGSQDFRSDIRGKLPPNLVWFLCQIQPQDSDRLFVISSDDWADISGDTFRVAEVNARLDMPSGDENTQRITRDIKKKISTLDSGGDLDTQLITITDSPSLSGPFTLIEGNRRSVAFLRRDTLADSRIFVGCSPCVVDCVWARHTYREYLKARQAMQGLA